MPFDLVKIKSKIHVPFGYKISGRIICVDASDSILQAANILRKHNIGAVIVKSNNVLVGILSERDIVFRVVSKNKSLRKTKVGRVMTKKVVTVNIEDGLNKIHHLMKEIKFRHLPVVKGGAVVGMVSNRDLVYLHKLRTRLVK